MPKIITRTGDLAREHCGLRLPLEVLRSGRGYYLGTANDSGPVSRESLEYWPSHAAAATALSSDPPTWTQRDAP